MLQPWGPQVHPQVKYLNNLSSTSWTGSSRSGILGGYKVPHCFSLGVGVSPDYPQPHRHLSWIPTALPTWLTWFNASAKSFWLMPQRLATFFWHLWCTFMPQSEVREKQGHQGPTPSRATNRLQENCLPCPRPGQDREVWRREQEKEGLFACAYSESSITPIIIGI